MSTPPRKPLPRALYRAHNVRELDRIAIEELGIPGATLMDRAGRSAFDVLAERWPEARRVAVACGHGNNAGDGFVLARYAAEAGLGVDVLLVGRAERLRGEALDAFEKMRAAGIEPRDFTPQALADADVVVDGLFGTGLDRGVEGRWADAIESINACGGGVLALDIPSGLHADTGRVLIAAVRAGITVTFIGLKQGMFTGEARDRCGDVVFDDLDVPPELYDRLAPDAERVGAEDFAGVLGRRARTAHKGRFGHVLVVGGDEGFAGAARLAGEGALRCGAGLVSIATRRAHAATIAAGRPELMCHGVESAAELEALAARANVVAVGPGLARETWGRSMLETALRLERPLILDADALNLLAEKGGAGAPAHARVLTPHPGEAGRLLGTSSAQIEQDRFAAARRMVEGYRAVVVLKGAGTIVDDGRAPPAVCGGGNPGMASGGVGDVLTGVVAGLLAQGLVPRDAAAAGVCVHAAAADRAARDGERGLIASDVLAELRAPANTL